MTEEVRTEMQYYKKMAIEKEAALKASRQSMLLHEKEKQLSITNIFHTTFTGKEQEVPEEFVGDQNHKSDYEHIYTALDVHNSFNNTHVVDVSQLNNETNNSGIDCANTITQQEIQNSLTITNEIFSEHNTTHNPDDQMRSNLTYINTDSSSSTTSEDDSTYGHYDCSEYLKVSSFLQDARQKAAEFGSKHRKTENNSSPCGDFDDVEDDKFNHLKKYPAMYSILKDEKQMQLQDSYDIKRQYMCDMERFDNCKVLSSTSSITSSSEDAQAILHPPCETQKNNDSSLLCKSKSSTITFKDKFLSIPKMLSSSTHELDTSTALPVKLIRSNSYTLENPSPLLIKHIKSQDPCFIPAVQHSATVDNINTIKEYKTSIGNDAVLKKNTFSSQKCLFKGKTESDLFKTSSTLVPNMKTMAEILAQPVKPKPKPPKNYSNAHRKPMEERLSMYNTSGPIVMKKTTHSMKRNKPTPYSEIMANAKSHNRPTKAMGRTTSIMSSPKGRSNEIKPIEPSCSSHKNIIKGPLGKGPVQQSSRNKKLPEPKSNKSPPIISNNKYTSNNFEKILTEIQEKHNKQMEELVKRQEEEQKMMQDSFRKQQENLMKHIEEKFNNNHKINSCLTSSTPTLPLDTSSKKDEFNSTCSLSECLSSSPTTFYLSHLDEHAKDSCYGGASSGNDFYSCYESPKTRSQDFSNNNVLTKSVEDNSKTNFYHSVLSNIRDNFPEKDQDLQDLTTNIDQNCNITEPSLSIPYYHEFTHICIDKQNEAATVINAYIRGYLVRRLFRTEHTQSFVNIIKDTLIFILDLHHEKSPRSSSEVSDLKLKQRLLQQVKYNNYFVQKIIIPFTLIISTVDCCMLFIT